MIISKCIMCDQPIVTNQFYEFVHSKGYSIHCEGKASVATPPDRTEGTQRYMDSGEYEGEYGKD